MKKETICRFCNKSATYSPVKILEDRRMYVYFCHDCNTEYVYWGDKNTLSNYHIYTTINDKLYRWSVGGTHGNTAYIWSIGKPGIPGQAVNEEVKLLKHFKSGQYPEVTPQNINEKLKVLLVFL